MRIAQLSPLYESVPPALYGGTERVVSWLTEELVSRGHDVTLFASGDSETSATLVPVVDRALRLNKTGLLDPIAMHLAAAEMVRRRAGEFDIIHAHIDSLAYPALGGQQTPMVTTLHGRQDLDGLAMLYRLYCEQPVVAISRSQRASLPEAGWIATVHHGLPLDQYPVGEGRGDYIAFLGRISPEKRPEVAIRTAREVGARLVIAAKVDPADRRYFDDAIKPLLSGPGVDFIGEVDHQGKLDLLRHARGFLFPIKWPEPFGLVMIEAMACGTPVIATRAGSVDEVIAHGRSGFICDDDVELVQAIERIGEIDRAACRSWVEQHFSLARMAYDYERVYGRLIATGSLDRDHVHAPLAPRHVDADVVGIAPQLQIDARVRNAKSGDGHLLEKRR
jgi:glycosyltransferase involved in cell wall biosynthesis